MPGPLDRSRQLALVACAGARLAAGPDLPVFRDETAQHVRLFVVDDGVLVCAELANLGA